MDNYKQNSDSTVGQVTDKSYRENLTIINKQNNNYNYNNEMYLNKSLYKIAQTQQTRGIPSSSLQREESPRTSKRRVTDQTIQREAFTRTPTRGITESALQREAPPRTETFQRQNRTRTRRDENGDLVNKRIRRFAENISRTIRYRSESGEREEDITPGKRLRRDGENLSIIPIQE